jgi:hypothetical protein
VYTSNYRNSQERARQRLETELISIRFPEVSGIVVSMEYRNQKGPPMSRTLNYRPDNHAFFKVNCLGAGCEGGGLDMTGVLTNMIRNHDRSAKGSLHCSNGDPGASHADMSYRVSITYL